MLIATLPSCKKSNGWDEALNGEWVEVVPSNQRALPSNCELKFENESIIICNESIGASLNNDSKVHAKNGQIWISYRLSFRKHEEYRYDYVLDGTTLWLKEDLTANRSNVIGEQGSKMYRKK